MENRSLGLLAQSASDKHEGKVENLYEEKGHDAMFLLDIVEGVLLPSNELRSDDA